MIDKIVWKGQTIRLHDVERATVLDGKITLVLNNPTEAFAAFQLDQNDPALFERIEKALRARQGA